MIIVVNEFFYPLHPFISYFPSFLPSVSLSLCFCDWFTLSSSFLFTFLSSLFMNHPQKIYFSWIGNELGFLLPSGIHCFVVILFLFSMDYCYFIIYHNYCSSSSFSHHSFLGDGSSLLIWFDDTRELLLQFIHFFPLLFFNLLCSRVQFVFFFFLFLFLIISISFFASSDDYQHLSTTSSDWSSVHPALSSEWTHVHCLPASLIKSHQSLLHIHGILPPFLALFPSPHLSAVVPLIFLLQYSFLLFIFHNDYYYYYLYPPSLRSWKF